MFEKHLEMFRYILVLTLMTSGSTGYNSPHIIFIMADDLGWNDVSFHGSPQIPTPNIDALAATGIVLQNYYAAPLCSPSRGALMTGKYPSHIGLQHNVIHAGAPYGLPLHEKLLPQYLKDLGYEVHGVGKWHLGYCKKNFTPTYRGFDTFFGYWNGVIDYYDYTNYEEVDNIFGTQGIWGIDLHDGIKIVKEYRGEYATDLFTSKALRIIENHNESNPLFLYVPHLAAHIGNSYQTMQAPWENVAEFSYIKDMNRRIYAGVVFKLDESVGKIFASLYNKRMLNNSIIIFASDNGGAPEGILDGHGSNWPLRGAKMQLFEGGVRVPALIWSPLLKLKKPRASHQLMHISDWLPTLYVAAGGNNSDIGNIDGINMWDHLLHNAPSSRTELLVNIDQIDGEEALIRKGYKLILGALPSFWYGPSGREDLKIPSMDAWVWKNGSIVKDILEATERWLIDTPDTWRSDLSLNCSSPQISDFKNNVLDREPRLYNLIVDPCELNNLAKLQPKVLAEMMKTLEAYRKTAVKPLFTSVDPHGDPKCHGFGYVPWLDEEYKSDCPYF